MVKSLDTFEQPILSHEDVNHLNISLYNKQWDWSCNKESPKKKSEGPNVFTVKFYQTFKEEQITEVLKLFHEIEREGILPNWFYEVNSILIPKLGKETPKANIGQSV
jgi:pentatricopeptide repeat protein